LPDALCTRFSVGKPKGIRHFATLSHGRLYFLSFALSRPGTCHGSLVRSAFSNAQPRMLQLAVEFVGTGQLSEVMTSAAIV
jgi:hypothetical protein